MSSNDLTRNIDLSLFKKFINGIYCNSWVDSFGYRSVLKSHSFCRSVEDILDDSRAFWKKIPTGYRYEEFHFCSIRFFDVEKQQVAKAEDGENLKDLIKRVGNEFLEKVAWVSIDLGIDIELGERYEEEEDDGSNDDYQDVTMYEIVK